ncbi:MAG: Ribosomal RNA small subunit methyltransferase H [Candidatus Daviesbacteria bacterium GW2011_GWA2_38_24]|uniref:Ribosomal RNA small subunit methyltransferase H n=1 Tax=Candidatus Daviesbacteria bacterium GW2011_GWA2_38_24 TaxID=1618422 RepID=A0A0G0JHL9_9BACT|nr:MAG: Ribosomal RNA small subunit methyltransferase H [Candidatus Daviesbacteria bacterium GW2011_GWA2_38_24]KKQ80533.1 MAG: Ribosomal RNA small subunit methyltransferase H [Candidatus Daviesbacteria bacterium GW2011_GWA1_38_7]OGE23320.1 MAG: 16S rRNA (cytosine(1402)-N(4))-methyltransferase [Candidatus Daviesbacteria bacterium RIFCSPHIGHO2_01_FULL_38_8]
MDGYHKSVLLKEVIENLSVLRNSWYIDATLGDGGYSLEILKKGGKVVGIDADPEALERTRERLKKEGINKEDYILVEGNFSRLDEIIGELRWFGEFRGIVFDLGVSSLQLEKAEKGFSFLREGPLDMRMSPDLSVKAADLINGLNRGELEKLFWVYGEFRDKRVVDAIIEYRSRKPIQTTLELAGIIERAVGGRKKGDTHPATTIFQALRIAVNDELNSLKEGLEGAFERLTIGGRIAVVSFHSLEDRIVKNFFKDLEEKGEGEVLTKKPITPIEEEIRQNPRSRSAKLRILEKR